MWDVDCGYRSLLYGFFFADGTGDLDGIGNETKTKSEASTCTARHTAADSDRVRAGSTWYRRWIIRGEWGLPP